MERLASLRHLLAPSLARACEGASSSGRPPLECAISSLTRLSLGSTNHQGPSSPWHLGYRSAHSQAAGSAKAPASSGNQASTSAPEAGQGAASPATTSQPTAPSTLHASKALQHVNQKARPAKYTPWTSTRMLDRHRPIGKRMGFLIESLEEEQVRAIQAARPIPKFRPGDVLEVRMAAPEAGRKEYIFKGVCIARYNKGLRSAFKLFNYYPATGGLVQHLPLYMPDLKEIKVVGRIEGVRRAKLYYLLNEKAAGQLTFQEEPKAVEEAAAGSGAAAAAPAAAGAKGKGTAAGGGGKAAGKGKK